MPDRRRLPAERRAITHRFAIDGVKGYVSVGLYDDGTPGEIFIRVSKMGTPLEGTLHQFAVLASMALQNGIALETLVAKFKHVRFEPMGLTSNREIPFADSIVDYVFRWLELRFLGGNGNVEGSVEEADMPVRALPQVSQSRGVL